MAKTSESQRRGNKKYDDNHCKLYAIKVSDTRSQDVIDIMESVPVKNAYIVSLIRRDIYRRFSNHLVLPSGADVDATNAMKYEDEIAEHYDRITAQMNPETLSNILSLYVPETPPYVIVAEYLRSTETDPIIIE